MMSESDRKVQKGYFRAFLLAGVKDAEIAKRSGYGRVQIGRMRHGHAPVTKPVADAMMDIYKEVERASKDFQAYLRRNDLHLLPRNHRPERPTKKQRKEARRNKLKQV